MLLSSTTIIDISKLPTKTARIKYNNGKHDNFDVVSCNNKKASTSQKIWLVNWKKYLFVTSGYLILCIHPYRLKIGKNDFC